jgi:hypothetical protein
MLTYADVAATSGPLTGKRKHADMCGNGPLEQAVESGTQFTCFTSTVYVLYKFRWGLLALLVPLEQAVVPGAQFTCFTSTRVQILTPKLVQSIASPPAAANSRYVC